MKKLFLVISVLFLFSSTVLSKDKTLFGGINYDVNSAREEAFEDVIYKLPKEDLRPLIYDKKYDENTNAIKNNITLKDRDLKLYNMQYYKSYGVEYNSDKKYTYFYWFNSGMLKSVAIDRTKTEDSYPQKLYYYDARGDLVNVNFVVSPNEEYIYNKDGSLNCHWINGQAFNAKGKIVGDSQEIVDDL